MTDPRRDLPAAEIGDRKMASMDGEVVRPSRWIRRRPRRRTGRWLTHRRGLTDPVVDGLSRPSAGYSSETIFAEVSWSDGDGRHRDALVVRMAPPAVGTFADYDLVPQWQAQMAAADVGVPVADPGPRDRHPVARGRRSS